MLRSPGAESEARPRGAVARRGLWAAALVAVGMVIAHTLASRSVEIPSAIALLVALLCAVVGFGLRGNAARVVLGLAAILGGLGWFSARVLETPADHIARSFTESPRIVRIVGVVASAPELAPRASGALAEFAWDHGSVMRFLLDTRALEGIDGLTVPVSGRVWVRVSGESAPWRIGERVRLVGLGRAVGRPRNPGEPDWARWATARGIGGTVRIDDPSLVTALPEDRSIVARARWGIERWWGETRARARAVFRDAPGADEGTRALMGALVVGAREDGYQDVDRSFRRIGLSHVVAISGLHVSLLAGALIVLVRLTGDRPRLEAVALALALAFMIVIVPARSPVLRAVLIVIALRAGRLAGRRWDGLNMLGWVAAAVLAWQPTELWNPGFQLSFGIVGAMVWLVAPVRDRILPRDMDPDHRTPAQWALRWLLDVVIAGIVAWTVSAPAVAAHFGNASPAAPILTIVVLPLVLVAVVAGYAAVAAELVLGAWAAPMVSVALGAGDWLLGAVRWMERIPGAWINLGWIGAAWAASATVLILLWLWRGRWRSPVAWAACIAIIAWGLWGIATKGPGRGVALRIDALDVGDGSSYLLRAGNRAIMFDCGSRWFGIGERTIPDAIRALRSPRVETVIVSHHDTDHYAGLIDAAPVMGVRRVIVTPQFLEGASAAGDGPGAITIDRLRSMGIAIETVSVGDAIEIGGGIRLEVLWPPADLSASGDNDTSIVALARVPTPTGERRVLLTGDIERDAVERIEALHPDLRADIVEAPHHGSARMFSFRFVQRLDPAIVIQSSGPSRLGDGRWDAVKVGRVWLMTAEVGAASAEIRTDGLVRGWGFLHP